MFPRVWLSAVHGVILASVGLASVAVGATTVPKGKRAPRRAATHVVVRPIDLDAQGVSIRVAPGVGVMVAGARADAAVSGRVVATLAGGIELGGRIDAGALGERLARTVELRSPEGRGADQILGKGREGAFVTVAGKTAGGDLLCDTVGLVRARVVVPADAVSAEPHELVYPVVSERLAWVPAETELLAAPGGRPRARLGRGTRVAVLADAGEGEGRAGDAKWTAVRTYGAFALEGFVAKDRLAAADGAPPLEETLPKGLTPTHEVLVGAEATADAAGRRSIGTLHGGTLVSVGVEVAGPRVRVMLFGDVVGEVWVPAAALRPLEREIWNERD